MAKQLQEVAKQLENSNKDNIELIQENDKLKKEIERLKKENEKLKEEIQENEDFTDSLTEEVGTPILPNIEKLKEKIEELEYRIQLKDKDLNQLTSLYEYADKLWRETEYPQLPKICLREPQEIVSMLKCLSENIQLIQFDHYNEFHSIELETGCDIKQLIPMFNKYKKDVFELKKEIEEYKEGQKSCEEDIEELEKENKRLNLEVDDTIKELKEDKKILENYREEMGKIEKYTDEEIEDILDVIPYIEKLKKYEDWIYSVWSDLYWADKSGTEVSFKDISNASSYYENEKFVKENVVEDEDITEE